MAVQTKVEPTDVSRQQEAGVLARVLREGYGPGAWHGADLRAALADLSPRAALVRPGPGRHNAAEIAVHHAFCARGVAARLSGKEPPPFPLDGEDWFSIDDERRLSWRDVLSLVEQWQQRVTDIVAGIGAGTIASPLAEAERFDLVLGLTCHAVYHAGQVQLIKVLGAAT